MARSGPARTWSRLAAGALAGAATAAALIAAEMGASLLLQAPLPPPAWLFLAVYWVPAFAVAGALAALALPLPVATAALVWMPAAAYCAAVVTQELLPGRPRLAPLRLAALLASAAAAGAAAWTIEHALGRRQLPAVSAVALRALVLLPVVAAVHVAARALRGAPAAAALALPAAVAAVGVLSALILAPLAARLSARSAVAGAVALAAAIALGAGVQAGRPRPGTVRDDPQPAAVPGAATAPPNVVLVVLDTVRAANVSCYGYERRTTPHLDAFAAGALRFAAATTVSPWSVPAHASLFTGLFAPEHGAGRAQNDARTGRPRPAPLDARYVTLAEALAERGYATAGISANLLVAPHMNLAQGFRYYDVRPSPRALTPRYRTLLQRVQGLLPRAVLADPLLDAFPTAFRSAAEITDAAVDWLGRRPPERPYLLFLNYMDAHTPFVRRPGFSGRWPGRSARLPGYGLPGAEAVMAGRRPLTGEEAGHIRALYDDALSYLDHHLGRLLAALDAQPDRDRTWIIVTADHGEALGEHQRLGHDCVLYQQVLHVPLVMRYPRGFAQAARHGSVDERPMQLTDLTPAVLAAVDGAAPRETPATGRARVATVDCFCWRDHPRFHGAAGQALLEDGLKYMDEEGRAPALFDLDADPLEARDLAAARPGDAHRLRLELEHWRAALNPASPSTSGAPDAAREEALRALGYIQ